MRRASSAQARPLPWSATARVEEWFTQRSILTGNHTKACRLECSSILASQVRSRRSSSSVTQATRQAMRQSTAYRYHLTFAFQGTQAAGKWTPWILPDGLQAKLRENCAPGDPVCDPKGTDFNQHLKYIDAKYQAPSAVFIEAAFKGEALPKAPTSYLDP